MNYKIRSKSAMSLGEVLITLAVIGLVAMIAIPILTVAIPNKNETLIKKGQYVLERTVSDVINNEDYYPVHKELVPIEGTDELKTVATYGLRNTSRPAGTNCEGAAKFCCLMALNMTLYPDTVPDCTADAVYNFKTADGIEWKMPISDFSTADAQELRFRTLDRKGDDCYRTTSNDCHNDPNILTFKITPEGKMYSFTPASSTSEEE